MTSASSCDDPKCENPHIGDVSSRAPQQTLQIIYPYHLNKLLRSVIADAGKKKNRKVNMSAAAKVADPSRTADGGA